MYETRNALKYEILGFNTLVLFAGFREECINAIKQFNNVKSHQNDIYKMAKYFQDLNCVKQKRSEFILIGFDKSEPKVFEITADGNIIDNESAIKSSFLGTGGKHAEAFLSCNLNRPTITNFSSSEPALTPLEILHESVNHAAQLDPCTGGACYGI